MTPRLRWLVVLTTLLGSAFFAAPALAAAPSNDNFASATQVSGASGSINGTTIDATDESGEPSAGALGVWYSWKPAVSGAATFDTCTGTDFNTIIDVFTGPSLASLSLVTSADAGCSAGSMESLAPFRAQAGTRYWIRVGGYNFHQGIFTLRWNVQVNDDLATAQVVSGHGGSVSGSTLGATDEPGEPATSSGGLWYSWTAPGAGTVTFETCSGTEFATMLEAFTGTSIAGLSPVAYGAADCGPNGRQRSITFPTVAGRTYSIRISGWPGTAPNGGSFTLSWSYSGPDSTPVTATSLCLLTAQYVRGSARYQGLGLTALQQAQIDALVGGQCDALGRLVQRLTPYQKAIYIATYKLVVNTLAAGSWLTPAQRTTLVTMADQL